MPPYLDILTYLLAREGIQYVHFAYAEESLLIGSRVGWRRLFRITSFVWRDQLYIARHNFSEDTLSQWPLDLQRIWRDITVDVPE